MLMTTGRQRRTSKRIKPGFDPKVIFLPHLIPMTRGILDTVYADFVEGAFSNTEEARNGVRELYERYSTFMDRFHAAGWRRWLNEVASEGANLGTAGSVLMLARLDFEHDLCVDVHGLQSSKDPVAVRRDADIPISAGR